MKNSQSFVLIGMAAFCLILLVSEAFSTDPMDLFRAIQEDFKTELRINEMYFNEMSKATTLEKKYKIFYKYRMAFLEADLISEIEEMRKPLLGTPANVFPAIISYVDEDQKWEWSPISIDNYESYKRQISESLK